MKKSTTLALAGLMAVSAAASASVTRWNGFGASQAYIADVQDIWTLPGAIVNYKNAVYYELGQNNLGYESGEGFGSTGPGTNDTYQDLAGDMPWGGIHMALGPGVLGVWINRPYTEWTFNSAEDAFGRPGSFGNAVSWGISPEQTLDIIYGFNLSEKTALAVGIHQAGVSRAWEDDPATGNTDKFSRSFSGWGLDLGLEQKNVGPIGLLEVGLTIDIWSAVNERNDGTTDDKYNRNGMDTDLRIGADIPGDNGMFGRAEIGFNIDSNNTKAEPQNAPAAGSFVETKNSGLGVNLGYAMGGAKDNGMGLSGLMLYYRNDTGEAPYYGGNDVNKIGYSETRLEWSTGAEAKLKDWLTFRGGFSSNLLYNFTAVYEQGDNGAINKYTEWNTGERWYAYGPYDYNNLAKASFGATATFGSVAFDAVLNQDVFYTGGYMLSGVSAALATQASVSWGW